MADESVYGVRDLVEVIRRRAADLVNVKLAKCGGLGIGDLLELARAHGMGTVVGSMMETHVGVGAAAALVGGLRHDRGERPRRRLVGEPSPVVGGLTYDGGTVVLPPDPASGSRVCDEPSSRCGSASPWRPCGRPPRSAARPRRSGGGRPPDPDAWVAGLDAERTAERRPRAARPHAHPAARRRAGRPGGGAEGWCG